MDTFLRNTKIMDYCIKEKNSFRFGTNNRFLRVWAMPVIIKNNSLFRYS